MFLKYRILKSLEFGKYVSIEQVCSMFSNDTMSVGKAIVMLVGMGFIDHDSNNNISLKRITSLHEYRNYIMRRFLEISVSISAIVVAICNVIELIL